MIGSIDVRSSAFPSNGPIPARFTRDGGNVSPPLEWSGVPSGTRELALIVDDPDAPSPEPFAHWLVFHLPPTTTHLAEGVSRADRSDLPTGASEGRNSFRGDGYGGPSPPPGKAHHYHFSVYALDAPVEVKAGSDRRALLEAMRGHVLAQGEVVGTYARSPG